MILISFVFSACRSVPSHKRSLLYQCWRLSKVAILLSHLILPTAALINSVGRKD